MLHGRFGLLERQLRRSPVGFLVLRDTAVPCLQLELRVELAALDVVRENAKRLVDQFEVNAGFVVALAIRLAHNIGMVHPGQLEVRLFYRFYVGRWPHAEDFVIIYEFRFRIHIGYFPSVTARSSCRRLFANLLSG